MLLSILSIAFSAWHIARRSDDIGRWDVAGSIVVIILAVGLGAPIGGLAGYHVRLLWTNRTTIEMVSCSLSLYPAETVADHFARTAPSEGRPLTLPQPFHRAAPLEPLQAQEAVGEHDLARLPPTGARILARPERLCREGCEGRGGEGRGLRK